MSKLQKHQNWSFFSQDKILSLQAQKFSFQSIHDCHLLNTEYTWMQINALNPGEGETQWLRMPDALSEDPGLTPSTLMPAHSCLQLQSQGTWLPLLASRYQEYMWYTDIYESKTLINIKGIKVNQTVVISVKIVQTAYTDLRWGRIWCQFKVDLLPLHISGSFHGL